MAKEKPARSALQKFEIRTMLRSQLKQAPYNPRTIDDVAKGRLRDNLARVGLLEPIIVNQRTHHIVSGHQRIAILDRLEAGHDYEMEVAVVDLDEKTEREQVVFLNNELAMGSFDLVQLQSILTEVDYANCGYDTVDLRDLLGVDLERPAEPPAVPAPAPESPFVVLVFPSREANDSFMELLKLGPNDKYISGEAVAELVYKALAVQQV